MSIYAASAELAAAYAALASPEEDRRAVISLCPPRQHSVLNSPSPGRRVPAPLGRDRFRLPQLRHGLSLLAARQSKEPQMLRTATLAALAAVGVIAAVACGGSSITETSAISAGDSHTCGLRDDGALVCWGRNDDGRATPPAGSFTAVSAGPRTLAPCARAGSSNAGETTTADRPTCRAASSPPSA